MASENRAQSIASLDGYSFRLDACFVFLCIVILIFGYGSSYFELDWFTNSGAAVVALCVVWQALFQSIETKQILTLIASSSRMSVAYHQHQFDLLENYVDEIATTRQIRTAQDELSKIEGAHREEMNQIEKILIYQAAARIVRVMTPVLGTLVWGFGDYLT